MRWRIAAGAIIAFIIGAAVGGYIEHERVQNDAPTATAPATATTPTTVAASADWFGTNRASACPALTRWNGAVAEGAFIARGSRPWTETQAALLAQSATVDSAYQTMLPMANGVGKPEIEFLIEYQNRLTTALQASISAAGYADSQQSLASDQANEDIAILLAAAKQCSAG